MRVHAPTCVSLLLLLAACTRPPEQPAPQASPPPRAAPAAAAPTDPVRALGDAAATCMHWPGEEPYDEARSREIVAGIARDCPRAAALLKGDLALVKRTPALAAAAVDLVAHFGEEHGFGALGPELGALCPPAAAHYRAQLARRPMERYFPYFDQACPEQARAVCGPAGCAGAP